MGVFGNLVEFWEWLFLLVCVMLAVECLEGLYGSRGTLSVLVLMCLSFADFKTDKLFSYVRPRIGNITWENWFIVKCIFSHRQLNFQKIKLNVNIKTTLQAVHSNGCKPSLSWFYSIMDIRCPPTDEFNVIGTLHTIAYLHLTFLFM